MTASTVGIDDRKVVMTSLIRVRPGRGEPRAHSGAFMYWRKSMKKLTTLFAAVGVLAALSSPAFAAVEDMALMKTSHASTGAMGAMGMTATSASLTDTVVAGMDPATDMITLRHGELKNVGMPAMTMAYMANDTAMFKDIKEGDSVKVRVENVNGTLAIVKMVKQ